MQKYLIILREVNQPNSAFERFVPGDAGTESCFSVLGVEQKNNTVEVARGCVRTAYIWTQRPSQKFREH